MQAIPDLLFAVCGAIPLEGGLIAGLFLAGAAGSPLHCGPMCGGFVLGQVADRFAAIPAARMCEWRRIGAAVLVPYHVGRITTYAALGAAAGMGGAVLGDRPYLTGALLLLAAALFLLLAWRRGRMRFRRGSPVVAVRGSAGSVRIRRTAPGTATGGTALHDPVSASAPPAFAPDPEEEPRHRRPGGIPALAMTLRRPGAASAGWLRGLPLGVLLGFLPCGFLYGAIIAAAASHDPLTGALGMAAFGAGTVPALIVVGVVGQAAGRRWQAVIASLAPFVLSLNAALLVLLALKGMLA